MAGKYVSVEKVLEFLQHHAKVQSQVRSAIVEFKFGVMEGIDSDKLSDAAIFLRDSLVDLTDEDLEALELQSLII